MKTRPLVVSLCFNQHQLLLCHFSWVVFSFLFFRQGFTIYVQPRLPELELGILLSGLPRTVITGMSHHTSYCAMFLMLEFMFKKTCTTIPSCRFDT